MVEPEIRYEGDGQGVVTVICESEQGESEVEVGTFPKNLAADH